MSKYFQSPFQMMHKFINSKNCIMKMRHKVLIAILFWLCFYFVLPGFVCLLGFFTGTCIVIERHLWFKQIP